MSPLYGSLLSSHGFPTRNLRCKRRKVNFTIPSVVLQIDAVELKPGDPLFPNRR